MKNERWFGFWGVSGLKEERQHKGNNGYVETVLLWTGLNSAFSFKSKTKADRIKRDCGFSIRNQI